MSVVLRPLERADRSRVLCWRNSPDVASYMYSDHLISLAEHARWLEAALSAIDRRYWIIELEGAPVGLANLTRIDQTARRCEWAYYLADPVTRGKGIGACVEFIVLDHVFGALGFNKLWCEVLLENEVVWTLHENFGFQREAHFRDHVWKGGRFQDVVGLGLLASDWSQNRGACESRLTAKGHELSKLVML